MDTREKIIFDIFADWADSCHEQWIARYDNPKIKVQRARLRDDANNKFLALVRLDIYDSFERYSKAKEQFHDAAKEYFLYRVDSEHHYEYDNVIDRMIWFEEKWSWIKEALGKSSNISNFIDQLNEDNSNYHFAWKLLNDLPVQEDNVENFALLKMNEMERIIRKQ